MADKKKTRTGSRYEPRADLAKRGGRRRRATADALRRRLRLDRFEAPEIAAEYNEGDAFADSVAFGGCHTRPLTPSEMVHVAAVAVDHGVDAGAYSEQIAVLVFSALQAAGVELVNRRDLYNAYEPMHTADVARRVAEAEKNGAFQ